MEEVMSNDADELQNVKPLTATDALPITDQQRWGEPLPPARRAELDGQLLAWERAAGAGSPQLRTGPFDGERLTGADVFYLAVRALSRPTGDVISADRRLREASGHIELARAVDLSDLHLERSGLRGAHLENAVLDGAHLEGAVLEDAHLQGASLRKAHLERAILDEAHLEDSHLDRAHLERATLEEAHLERATLDEARLDEAFLQAAHLEGARLTHASLERANFFNAYLEGASLDGSQLGHATFFGAHLAGASLREAHLHSTSLRSAHLAGASLRAAHLEGADLQEAHLEGVPMAPSDLTRVRPPTDMRLAFFDPGTRLDGVTLGDPRHGYVSVADVRWGGVNLAVVNWLPKMPLGDERFAKDWKSPPLAAEPGDRVSRGERAQARKTAALDRIERYRAAVRANRQLAVALQAQGMNEEAARFAYRAQWLQGKVHWHRRRFGSYLLSRFLYLLAGYGYKPERSLAIYVLAILGFAFAYFQVTHNLQSGVSPLRWYEALVLSVSSFHGRGFFQPVQSLGDPVAILAAVEAIIGLVIEVSFIATFTQRFFAAK
jgi:uncharacterized protein YjbI with pentapeptide repeats